MHSSLALIYGLASTGKTLVLYMVLSALFRSLYEPTPTHTTTPKILVLSPLNQNVNNLITRHIGARLGTEVKVMRYYSKTTEDDIFKHHAKQSSQVAGVKPSAINADALL